MRTIKANGWREAEDRVEKLLRKNPEEFIRVFIEGVLAYYVGEETEDANV